MRPLVAGMALVGAVAGLSLLPDRPSLGQEPAPRLKDAGTYTETPVRGRPFYAVKQRLLSPSDGRATIYTEWLLPRPGHYTVRYQVRGPSGALYVGGTQPVEAPERVWPTWFTFQLPKGEKAKGLVGRWTAEVFLNADRLATLSFELVDRDLRLETDSSIAVFPYVVDIETGGRDPAFVSEWTEIPRASAGYVAAELRRLFARVIPPEDSRSLFGGDFSPADTENPARRSRVRQSLGADVALAGRVVVPAEGPARARLEVALVDLSTGSVERFSATLPARTGLGPRETMEELSLDLLGQPSFLSSVRARAAKTADSPVSQPAAGTAAPTPPAPRDGSKPPKSIPDKSVPEIVKEEADAVVFVRVTTDAGERSVGTGFVVRPTGEILTNFHLIEGARTLTVKLRNEDVYDEVRVLSTDARRDLALIKVRGWNLRVVRRGDSDLVQVGERVVTIGNPRGLEQTVTDGLVSAIRDTGKGYRLFQISAPISTGSSGGPVFNMAGEVIGITSAYLEGGQNLNFAIPINYGLALLPDADPPSAGQAPAPPVQSGGATR